MKKNVFAVVLITILIGLSLVACTRSATTKQPEQATATAEIPFPIATVDPNARLTEIVQQTQSAQESPAAPAEVTPIIVSTETPVPQPTPTMPVLPTLSRPETYTLQQGEWPICIARRYDLDLNAFLTVNNLSMNSKPDAGSVLKIPATGSWTSGPRSLKTHPADYTVQAGDTIYSVACDFGDVDPMAIVAANNLQAPYTLTAGAVIRIP
ncbi:MAG: LysM peptidoglycan-binding domain-containing protein [Chloroflexota bacterium]|jgi:LysM repeat protein